MYFLSKSYHFSIFYDRILEKYKCEKQENMSMPEKIKWGFIGCGKVVEKKSGAAFRDVPHSCVHANMRRDPEQARSSAQKFSAPHWFSRIDDLLASDADAIYIATPPGLHYEQALKCCDYGKPVYIEKPFARNYAEAKAIVHAFAQKNLPVYVGHYRRALPRFQKIYQLLSQGCIGRVCSVDFYLNRIFSKREAEHSWLYHPALSGGGKFFDIAPHTIDLMIYLFGDMKELHGFAINSGTDCPLEDHAAFSFVTVQDIVGTANFNCISDRKDDRMIVTGRKGGADPLKQGHCPCTGADALPTCQAIDRILEGFYHGRQDDFWNYPERWGNQD